MKIFKIATLMMLLLLAVAIPATASLMTLDVPFDSANFTANNVMTWTVVSTGQKHYRFYQENTQLFMSFKIQGTIGGTPSTKLFVKLPNGLISKNSVSFIVAVNSFGTGWQWGFGNVSAGGNTIDFQLSQPTTFSNWGVGSAEVDFVGVIEVQ
ncbi:MAG: hypothetical protein ACREJN_07125 [Nitrospiraceae bacterium]